jgi:hypothetical protein
MEAQGPYEIKSNGNKTPFNDYPTPYRLISRYIKNGANAASGVRA